MNRRQFVVTSAASLAAAPLAFHLDVRAAGRDKSESATWTHVQKIAERLAKEPYVAPVARVPLPLRDIGYDVYRDIQFMPKHGLWHDEGLGFEVQFSPTAYLYHAPVDIFAVDQDKITPVKLTVPMFKWGPMAEDMRAETDLPCSGFRILAPLNSTKHLDELAVFQGASYFRGLGRGHQYGLSARGLALNTAKQEPEEFPAFRGFWIERPTHPSHVTVCALLDGPSVSGAFRYVIWPGEATVMEVESILFPRADLTHAGIAPLTSMFWFDGRDAADRQDFRGAVHDSDGLIALSEKGEWLWRPLSSPVHNQASAFTGANPRGFGLLQRNRDFTVYQDLEARYERRPSVWVERTNDWGDGYVELIEIPAQQEWYDNIVAYWHPASPLRAGERYAFAYRLSWCNEPPATAPLFRVKRTGIGEGWPKKVRFAVDFESTATPPPESVGHIYDALGVIPRKAEAMRPVEAVVSASAGVLSAPVTQPNPHVNGVRVAFELDPKEESTIELRLSLMVGDEVNSEVWLYRWLRPSPVAAQTTAPAPTNAEAISETPKVEGTGK